MTPVPEPQHFSESAHPDVLLIISHLGHGGAQRVVCNLANLLCHEGYKVRILVMKHSSNTALELNQAVEVDQLIYVPPKRTFAHLAGFIRLSTWLPKLRARIKASRAPCVVSFIRPTNAKVLIACFGLRHQRIVVCERNDPARQALGRHWAALSWLLYRTADMVAVNSLGAKTTLARYVPERKLAYLPNILTFPPPGQVSSVGQSSILAVGRIVHQKGFDVLIRAFAECGDRLAGWRIAVLGEGPEKHALKRLAEDLNVASQIVWCGHVANPFEFYLSASVFAMPSRYEGMPNALLEAMSCGMACIVSDASPGPLEVIEHGHNGLVIGANDVTQLANSLTWLAENPGERKRLGTAAQTSVTQFLPQNALLRWQELLELPQMPEGDGPVGGSRNVPTRKFPPRRSSRIYLLVRQLLHYLFRPRVWPDLGRWAAKRIKDRVVGKDIAAIEARQQMGDATEWCSRESQSPSAALSALGLDAQILSVQSRFPREYSSAKARVDTVPFRLGGASNIDLIYTLCEALKATRVIETGVANGWSSLAILLSLASRCNATLHSIDLPYLKYQNDPWVGIAVPESYYGHWTLHRMADRDGLPRALEALGRIDFAHYDSDKSQAGREFAYPLLWQALRPGGVLFSDDVNDNFGFRDFCERIGMKPLIIRQGDKYQGLLRKP